MAYLILYWGSMRLFGLIFDIKNIIIFSYIFEGLIFLCESYYFNIMDKQQSLIIALLSFIIALIIMQREPCRLLGLTEMPVARTT